MVPILETFFWTAFGILVYTYVGYPLILLILTAIKKKEKSWRVTNGSIYEAVTLLVAAFNEEKVIEEKITNSLALAYPAGKINFLFVSDGSTDNTASIIQKFPSIKHLHENERRGKLAAVNRAMAHVTTPFVIFSDANTMLNSECVSHLLKHYANKKVGAVSGEKKVTGDGEGMYWKYESFLKKLDAKLYTVVGAAGELFSMRTSLYTPLPENIILDDFVQSLTLCTKGYVVQYEPAAFGVEKSSLSEQDEMERKVRISAGGFQAMRYLKKLFNVFQYPVISFQYISHRVLRWTLCPISLLILLISSMGLWYLTTGLFWLVAALAHGIFYAAALAGWLMARQNRRSQVFYLPFYFVFMHFCVFAGFARYLGGKQGAAWAKADR